MSELRELGQNLVRTIEAQKRISEELGAALCAALKPVIPDIHFQRGIGWDIITLSSESTADSWRPGTGSLYLGTVIRRLFKESGIPLEWLESRIRLNPDRIRQVEEILRPLLANDEIQVDSCITDDGVKPPSFPRTPDSPASCP